ncbi:hypothetical protein [Streptosporangium sp. NPDC002721]|uniref:hypothetical protein n=1 Tax=Streptosporangium sp. NPDC002721 TaxID=3366188 RepID=UPI0036C2EE1E
MRKELALIYVAISTSVIVAGFCTALVFKNFSLWDAFKATLDMGQSLMIILLATSLGVTVGRLFRFMESGR